MEYEYEVVPFTIPEERPCLLLAGDLLGGVNPDWLHHTLHWALCTTEDENGMALNKEQVVTVIREWERMNPHAMADTALRAVKGRAAELGPLQHEEGRLPKDLGAAFIVLKAFDHAKSGRGVAWVQRG